MLLNENLINMLEQMYTIRYFEEKVKELKFSGLIRAGVHLCTGQEATAVGANFALNNNDYIILTHRGDGHFIAKGGDINRLMAEILNRGTGYCKGKGGHVHLTQVDKGILGGIGIVGGQFGPSCGVGLSIKYRKTGQVLLCFFSDGAANEGGFHEALNLASLWKLPVIYFCENNLYALSTSTSISTSINNIAERARGYNIPGKILDGNNVEEVYESTKKAVEKARSGGGPSLIEAKVYRYEGHWDGDPQIYRTKEEIQRHKKQDPIKLLEKKLLHEGIIQSNKLKCIKEKAIRIVNKSVEFAKESPKPDISEAFKDLYA